MITNSRHHYGAVTKTFHWLTALLILALIPLGILANDWGIATGDEVATKALLFSLHKTLGVVLFFVALARIAWAVSQPKPDPVHLGNRFEMFLAEAVHWTLYGALVLVPLTGWIHHAATTGYAPIWWPLGQSLPFVPKDEAFASLFAILHTSFERILAVSLLLHIAGALKHHFWDKDATLRRMLPGSAASTDTVSHTRSSLPVIAALAVFVCVGLAAALTQPSQQRAASDASIAVVPSAWAVQDGSLAIAITQFGSVVTGSFGGWTAAIDYDPDTQTGQVEVVVDIRSLSLGSVTDQALGPDYFDAGQFETATFSATIQQGETGLVATGPLVLRGTAVPISLPFELALDGDIATMSGTVTLDRRAFGIGVVPMPDEGSLGFAVQVSIALTAAR